jgi:hypothetical protein
MQPTSVSSQAKILETKMILNTVVLILIRIEHLLLLPLQAQLHLLQRFNSVLLRLLYLSHWHLLLPLCLPQRLPAVQLLHLALRNRQLPLPAILLRRHLLLLPRQAQLLLLQRFSSVMYLLLVPHQLVPNRLPRLLWVASMALILLMTAQAIQCGQ